MEEEVDNMGTIELALLYTNKNELVEEIIAGIESWISSVDEHLRSSDSTDLARHHKKRMQTLRSFCV